VANVGFAVGAPHTDGPRGARGQAGGAGGAATGAGLIDSVLASGTKSGYVFTVATSGATGTGPSTTYTVNGDPQNSQTGQRHFYSDQSGVIRANVSAVATATDGPLQ